MKFICSTNDITSAIVNVHRSIPSKPEKPILEGVLLQAVNGQVKITAYDESIGVVTSIPAKIVENGNAVINGKIFADIIKSLSAEETFIEADNETMYISNGLTDFTIIVMNAAEYPELPLFEVLASSKIESKTLKSMISQTAYAISENKNKPVYTGSLFSFKDNELTIVAIDGFRMAVRREKIESSQKNSIIVPGKAQHEIIRLLTDEKEHVEIKIGQRHVIFLIGKYTLISRLIEGEFLDYNASIPKSFSAEVIVNSRMITESVERMSILNNEKVQTPVVCKMLKNEIKLSCQSSTGRAKDVVEAINSGEELEAGFNIRYLFEALKNIDTDEIKLMMNNAHTPLLIKPVNGESFLYLVLPMIYSANL